MLGIFWCLATDWPPDHCVFRKCISCHFDLGSDWPVRPLMQVDKAVIHQFSLSLPCILHKPLSTCGMVSQHLDGARFGFKLCWSQYIPSEMSQTQMFWTFSVSHAGNTVGAGPWFCLVQLDYVRRTHHQSALAIAMNCAKHVAMLLVLAFGLAHTMATTTYFWNVGSSSCKSLDFCIHQLLGNWMPEFLVLVGTSWD